MKKIIITRLWNRWVRLVTKYMQKNGMSQTELSKFVNMERSHLNALINNNGRILSIYYLNKFITRGVIKVGDIYDGRPESERERDYWIRAKIMEKRQTLLQKIAKLEEKGIDIENIIDGMHPDLLK